MCDRWWCSLCLTAPSEGEPSLPRKIGCPIFGSTENGPCKLGLRRLSKWQQPLAWSRRDHQKGVPVAALLGHNRAGTRRKRGAWMKGPAGQLLQGRCLLLLLQGSILQQCSSCHDSHSIRCHVQQRKGTVKWLLFLFCPLKIIHQVSNLGERRRNLRVQSSHPSAEPQRATLVSTSLDFARACSGSHKTGQPSEVLVKEWEEVGLKPP